MGLERARRLLHHRYLRFQCRRQQPGLRRIRDFLQPARQRCHSNPQHHLHRSLRLRLMRYHASHHRLARRVRLLVQPPHCQSSPRSSLARGQELQTSPILLVRVRQHDVL